jgi:hypothetical protein
MHINEIVDGYVEAIEFTECRSDNPELEYADFSEQVWEHAAEAAKGIWDAFGPDLLRGTGATGKQIGRDLWFTRNGHGVGFWDRPEIYGPITSEHLTQYAQSIGECWAGLGEDGSIYID